MASFPESICFSPVKVFSSSEVTSSSEDALVPWRNRRPQAVLQRRGGRPGEPSIGTMGRKLILCCACMATLLTLLAGGAGSPQAAQRTLNKELAALLASGAVDQATY